MKNFQSLGLSPNIIKALEERSYTKATPIQEKAIPVILQGENLIAAAQTGTGKTAGFTLPILEKLVQGPRAGNKQMRALILAPTRELAHQVSQSVRAYSQHLELTSMVVYGGVKVGPQIMRLRRGVDILVATPGRLLDLYEQKALKFNQVEMFVLDEADRMLDLGFINDIKKINSVLPPKKQTLLFSATFTKQVKALTKNIVQNAKHISVSPPNTTATSVKQTVIPCDKKAKTELLHSLLLQKSWHHVLVFTKTKRSADSVHRFLKKEKVDVTVVHGDKSQGSRARALKLFKEGKVQVLVATDVAARGLDIKELPFVVNYELPQASEDYIHRIGRTGRAGLKGEAWSLVCAAEADQLFEIEKLINAQIPREYEPEFVPIHDVPKEPKRLAKPKAKPKSRAKAPSRFKDKARSKPGRKPSTKAKRAHGRSDSKDKRSDGTKPRSKSKATTRDNEKPGSKPKKSVVSRDKARSKPGAKASLKAKPKIKPKAKTHAKVKSKPAAKKTFAKKRTETKAKRPTSRRPK